MKYAGVHRALLVLPFISLAANGAMAFLPMLAVVRWAKASENSTEYSLNNTVKAILFLPTTREQKYKAKQVSDAFFHRAGDMFSAGTVLVGTAVLGLSTVGFAIFNLVLVLVWLTFAVRVGREYNALVKSGKPPETRGAKVRHPFAAAGA